MLVYLDNNVICSIEDKTYSLSKIIENIKGTQIEFPYSHAHIQEADNITDSKNESRFELIYRRLKTLQHISRGQYIYHDRNLEKITVFNENPATVLKTIRQVPFAKPSMKGFLNVVTFEQREQIRTMLGIDIKELNNYDPKQVVEHISKKVSVFGSEFNFISMIEMSMTYHPNGQSFGIMHRIAGIFELLDFMGYWKDKETELSNYARLWDSIHTFFGSYCEYFISDDKRTRNKAKVVFELYDIPTRIVSSNGID
jgi:hypothetical protein